MEEGTMKLSMIALLFASLGVQLTVAGKAIALFNVRGAIYMYAMNDACLHHGLSLGTQSSKAK
jgi:nitrite reductase/ring-hydroxylating ferredoxin subunit